MVTADDLRVAQQTVHKMAADKTSAADDEEALVSHDRADLQTANVLSPNLCAKQQIPLGRKPA